MYCPHSCFSIKWSTTKANLDLCANDKKQHSHLKPFCSLSLSLLPISLTFSLCSRLYSSSNAPSYTFLFFFLILCFSFLLVSLPQSLSLSLSHPLSPSHFLFLFPPSPYHPPYRERDSVELPSSWSIITTQLSLPLAVFLLACQPFSECTQDTHLII